MSKLYKIELQSTYLNTPCVTNCSTKKVFFLLIAGFSLTEKYGFYLITIDVKYTVTFLSYGWFDSVVYSVKFWGRFQF